MAHKASLSGFPEYLPAERLVENHVLDTLRTTFELHGFSSIETRSVETIEQLLRKGDIDKEVYSVSRLLDDNATKAKEKLALHFDLTVPFARYVVENAGYLNFPFSRYQIQKVWRGERPQEGRAREFTQADIDVVGDGELPFRYDVTLALVVVDALSKLPIPDFKLRVNNRKLAEGFYLGLGLTDTAAVLRSIDKLERIGADAVAQELQREVGASEEQAQAALELAQIRTEDSSFAASPVSTARRGAAGSTARLMTASAMGPASWCSATEVMRPTARGLPSTKSSLPAAGRVCSEPSRSRKTRRRGGCPRLCTRATVSCPI